MEAPTANPPPLMQIWRLQKSGSTAMRLFVMVALVTVTCCVVVPTSPSLAIPPPDWFAVLPLIVLFVTARVAATP